MWGGVLWEVGYNILWEQSCEISVKPSERAKYCKKVVYEYTGKSRGVEMTVKIKLNLKN